MKCQLCKKETELERSHIIPKFVYRYIKKTSPTTTKRLRNGDNPNKAQQDGEAIPFLCGECEDKFSRVEKVFNDFVFSKSTQNELKNMEVTEDIFYFSVSLIWRCLKFRIYKNLKIDELTDKEMQIMNKFLEDCETYLNNKNISSIQNYKFHLIPTNSIHIVDFKHDMLSIERGTDHSFRAFSINEGEGKDYLLYYVKIPFLLFIVEIVENSTGTQNWKGTELAIGEFIFDYGNLDVDNIVYEILKTMAENIEGYSQLLSSKQLDSILKSHLDYMSKTSDSKTNTK